MNKILISVLILIVLYLIYSYYFNKDTEKKENYSDIKSPSEIIIVLFYSENCGGCKLMKPQWKLLRQKYKNFMYREVLIDVNTSDNVRDYSLTAVPTIRAYYKDGDNLGNLIYEYPLGKALDPEEFVNIINSFRK